MKLQTLKLNDFGDVPISLPMQARLRMERFIATLSEQGKLDAFLTLITPSRIISTKNNNFFLDHFAFFDSLSRRYPLLEIEFFSVPIKRNETLGSIQKRIARNAQAESLLSFDAIDVFSFEKANFEEKLFKRMDYAFVLGRKPNSLNYHDRQYQLARNYDSEKPVLITRSPEDALRRAQISPLPTPKKKTFDYDD